MAIGFVNKYTATYNPGNTKQSVLAANLKDAMNLIMPLETSIEPEIVQCVEKSISIEVADPVTP